MAKQSAGLLIYRRRAGELEVFLVHPGGPFWKNKDDGAWSIPKGEFAADEDPLAAAQRELQEETGFSVARPFAEMSPIKQRSGKVVYTWLVEGNFDATAIRSNTFAMEWPPRSGKMQEFPEVDRAEWFGLESAALKINKGQRALLDELRTQVE
jgi:predicted NUDIX family NTP pyrophosphohydrolase